MTKFKEYELESVCDRLSSGKSIKGAEVFDAAQYPVYGGNGLRGYTKMKNFEGDCAIIGRQGAYCGNVRYFSGEAYMTEHAVVVQANKNNNTRYLSYLLSTMNLGRLSGQSAQPGLSVKVLGKQIINLPEKSVQDKIVSVLALLDEKISNNEQINRNLEDQAFALFDSCFPGVIYGERKIGDYISPLRGKNLLSKDAVSGDVPVIAGGLSPSTYHNEANTVGPVLTISASGANAGYVGLWNQSVWSSDSSYIDSKMTDDVYFWYVMLKKRQKEIFDSQTGSAQPHIYPKHIEVMPVIDIDKNAVEAYTKEITPMFGMIGSNNKENVRLAELRDSLLPKLMSGELDVSNLGI